MPSKDKAYTGPSPGAGTGLFSSDSIVGGCYPRVLPTTVRAVIQLHLRHTKKLLIEEEWQSIQRLQSHIDDLRRVGGERWESICLMSKGTTMYLGQGVNEGLIKELYCRVMINSLTLVTPTFDPVGIFVDPFAALINHSCDPNAVVVFDGPSFSVRSMRNIGKDEEITISYIDCTNPFTRRQSDLQDRYFFACSCDKCQRGSQTQEDTLLGSKMADMTEEGELRKTEQIAWESLQDAKEATEPTKSIQLLRQGNQRLRDLAYVWPIHRQPWPSIHQQLAVNLLSAGKWTEALAHMLQTYFQIDPVLFPQPFHPVRVVHNWTLAMLMLQITSLSTSDPASIYVVQKYEPDYGTIIHGLLKEVEGNVGASHGPHSHFAVMVKRKVEEVNVDMTRADTAQGALKKDKLEKEWKILRSFANEVAPIDVVRS
ncbi:MAG: hypothetical protein M1827_007025 [Pycnora praestabilis]|nr:MAG: hypothetical protein M1827_007025 [Pycnora praestabilis]